MLRHLLNCSSLDDATWSALVHEATRYHEAGKTWTRRADGRSIALLFFNPSLRTRTSMELAAAQLGAHATTLTPGQGTWAFEWEEGVVMNGEAPEHIQEAVGVLSRYYDAIGVRLFAGKEDYETDRDDVLLRRFVEYATVPVVNLESAFYHPCQGLADAATLLSHFGGDVKGRRFTLAWAYHPKALPMAVPNSAVLAAARLGMHVSVARPDEYALDATIMHRARLYAEQHGTSIRETDDLASAVVGTDVIYAKAWGGSRLYDDAAGEANRRAKLQSWRVTNSLMRTAGDAVFMHCLPVRRNVVVDDDVLDSRRAIHLKQAEFRLHAQKALLSHIWDLAPRLSSTTEEKWSVA